LALARAFAGDLLNGEDDDDVDDTPHVIAPESAGRHGPAPQVIDCDSSQHEAELIASQVADLIASGHDPNQIGVIWRDYAHAARIEKALRRAGVPLRTATTSRDKKALFQGPPSVKLVSAHSSKGLEFDGVFVSGFGRQAKAEEDPVTEARLMYVAMTRAMTRLWVVRKQSRPASPESAISPTDSAIAESAL
jgi:superfamily I DNA/RNA helicase